MNQPMRHMSFSLVLATSLILLQGGAVWAQTCPMGDPTPIKCTGEESTLSCDSQQVLCALAKSCPGILGRADGCSTPLYDSISDKYKKVFAPACDDHDRCYSTPGVSQQQCDNEFLSRMLSLCGNDAVTSKTPGFTKVECRTVAGTWATAVAGFAATSYAGDQTWAETHGPCNADCHNAIAMDRRCTKNNQGERCYQDSTKQYGECGMTGVTPDCKPSMANCDEECQDKARVCNKLNQGQRCYQQSTKQWGHCGMTMGSGDCKPD